MSCLFAFPSTEIQKAARILRTFTCTSFNPRHICSHLSHSIRLLLLFILADEVLDVAIATPNDAKKTQKVLVKIPPHVCTFSSLLSASSQSFLTLSTSTLMSRVSCLVSRRVFGVVDPQRSRSCDLHHVSDGPGILSS